jgi:hypothetical protein
MVAKLCLLPQWADGRLKGKTIDLRHKFYVAVLKLTSIYLNVAIGAIICISDAYGEAWKNNFLVKK